MSKYRTIGQIFEEELLQWGLRGDPYLWRAMRDSFSASPMPSSASKLENFLENVFEQLTGRPFSTTKFFRVPAFAHGGMSSGGISPQFRRETTLPLLLERYAET